MKRPNKKCWQHFENQKNKRFRCDKSGIRKRGGGREDFILYVNQHKLVIEDFVSLRNENLGEKIEYFLDKILNERDKWFVFLKV